MKTSTRFLLAATFLLFALNVPVQAGSAESGSKWGLGARYHKEQGDLEDLPFGDGDISYALDYEYHQPNAYWQLVAGFCPDATRSNGVDYVITPALNLIAKDGMWEGGAGVLASYVSDDNPDNDEWILPYWQLILGIKLPVFGIPLSIHALYPFESLSDISNFEIGNVEFAAMMKFNL
jgi:hypothetical protein